MVGASLPQLEVCANPLDKINSRRRRPKTIEPEGLMPEICVLGDARSRAKAQRGSGLRVPKFGIQAVFSIGA
eukprot:s849_g14.t1